MSSLDSLPPVFQRVTAVVASQIPLTQQTLSPGGDSETR